MLGKNVLQEDLVDSAHHFDVVLLNGQFGLPEEVRSGGSLQIAVSEVKTRRKTNAEEKYLGVQENGSQRELSEEKRRKIEKKEKRLQSEADEEEERNAGEEHERRQLPEELQVLLAVGGRREESGVDWLSLGGTVHQKQGEQVLEQNEESGQKGTRDAQS